MAFLKTKIGEDGARLLNGVPMTSYDSMTLTGGELKAVNTSMQGQGGIINAAFKDSADGLYRSDVSEQSKEVSTSVGREYSEKQEPVSISMVEDVSEEPSSSSAKHLHIKDEIVSLGAKGLNALETGCDKSNTVSYFKLQSVLEKEDQLSKSREIETDKNDTCHENQPDQEKRTVVTDSPTTPRHDASSERRPYYTGDVMQEKPAPGDKEPSENKDSVDGTTTQRTPVIFPYKTMDEINWILNHKLSRSVDLSMPRIEAALNSYRISS